MLAQPLSCSSHTRSPNKSTSTKSPPTAPSLPAPSTPSLVHRLRTHHQHRRGRELHASNTDAIDPGEQCREGVQLLLPIGQSIGLSELQRDKHERKQRVVPRRGGGFEYHRADMHRGDRAAVLCGGVGDIVCVEEEGE
jgi:hypothetical protein